MPRVKHQGKARKRHQYYHGNKHRILAKADDALEADVSTVNVRG